MQPASQATGPDVSLYVTRKQDSVLTTTELVHVKSPVTFSGFLRESGVNIRHTGWGPSDWRSNTGRCGGVLRQFQVTCLNEKGQAPGPKLHKLIRVNVTCPVLKSLLSRQFGKLRWRVI